MTEHPAQAAYDAALRVQRRHEHRLLALPGVTGVGTKLVDDGVAIVVTLAADGELPPELDHDELDGVRLLVERGRYEPQ